MGNPRVGDQSKWAGFHFDHSIIDQAIVRQLHRGEFMGQAQNIVLVGGPGTGKTHLAAAFGVHAIEHLRHRVRFFSTLDLVNALELEKAVGKQGQLAPGWLPPISSASTNSAIYPSVRPECVAVPSHRQAL